MINKKSYSTLEKWNKWKLNPRHKGTVIKQIHEWKLEPKDQINKLITVIVLNWKEIWVMPKDDTYKLYKFQSATSDY